MKHPGFPSRVTWALFTALTLQLFHQPIDARAGTLWTKTYGGALLDRTEHVIETFDGGLLLSGRTESFGVGNWDVWLIRTDADGDTLWTKIYGGPGNDWSNSVSHTSDGGFIVSATTRSFGRADADTWLIRTDANGDTLWTKIFGGTLDDWGNGAKQTPDGGFIMGSGSRSQGGGDTDWWLVRTDSLGVPLWDRSFGGEEAEADGAVLALLDGSIVSVAKTWSFGAGSCDIWLIKTDANGDSLWSRTYGGPGFDKPHSLEKTDDGGFIIAGETDTYGSGGLDVYLVRTDADGNVIWEKTFGGSGDDSGESAVETDDGGFLVTGYTRSFGAVGKDFYVLKVDAAGTLVWEQTSGGAAEDHGMYGIQTTDGHYVITGRTKSFGAGDFDVYLLKMSEFTALHLYEPSSPVPYGGAFAINGLLTNTADETKTFETRVLVTAPCGEIVQIGPSVLHILLPSECTVLYTVAAVPYGIPQGNYIYTLEVYENGELAASASQDFEVVEGCPGEGMSLRNGELPADFFVLLSSFR